MTQEKTPGVYVVEKNAFPNSVVAVATAVPAFIGYTEKASRGDSNLTNVPTRLSSLSEFELCFGGPPSTVCAVSLKDGKIRVTPDTHTRFLLYYGMRLFFDNGGGPCWVVSVGGYTDDQGAATVKSQADFEHAWGPLEKEQEATMVVVPDAVLLSLDDYKKVSQSALDHCTRLKSRVAILDVFEGYKPRDYDNEKDVISGSVNGFRTISSDMPSYGMAYYPWVNTNVIDPDDLDYTNLDDNTRRELKGRISDTLLHALKEGARAKGIAEDDEAFPKGLPGETDKLLQKMERPPEDETKADVFHHHQALMDVSPHYREVMTSVLQTLNVMPPGAAIAGVFTRTDNDFGVFRAPANTGIASVLSPTVVLSDADQQDLNVPLDGKAVNAIRTFKGRGVLVWGARTLDGNSQDWRYINVRRTLIMLEQSIYRAMQDYAFAPNDAGTWQTVKAMIENFLNAQWKAGALAGAQPDDAYEVSVGLGSTMTNDDILDGYMRVAVRAALMRPAEFIVITFQQKMQSS